MGRFRPAARLDAVYSPTNATAAALASFEDCSVEGAMVEFHVETQRRTMTARLCDCAALLDKWHKSLLQNATLFDGRLAQLEERLPYTEEVGGSNPLIAHSSVAPTSEVSCHVPQAQQPQEPSS